MQDNDFENINNYALVVITPEGKIYHVEDNGQKIHKYLMKELQDKDRIIKECVEKSLPFGGIYGTNLAKVGYINLMGKVASSSKGNEYYNKLLYLPTEPSETQTLKLNILLESLPKIIGPEGINPTLSIWKDGNWIDCGEITPDKFKGKNILKDLFEKYQDEKGNLR